MAGYKVEICGVNTSQLPLLKEEEKAELWTRIKAGDENAKKTYIEGNLALCSAWSNGFPVPASILTISFRSDASA